MPPQSISITTAPSSQQAYQDTVTCKVGEVKPVGDLEIQLLNGSLPLQGGRQEEDRNADNLTTSVVRKFDIKISGYGNVMNNFIRIVCDKEIEKVSNPLF